MAVAAPGKPGIRNRWDIRIPLRDGVETSGDLYLPPEGDGRTAYPVVLHRTPYNNQAKRFTPQAQKFASRGYAVVLQDVRGRHDSDGDWYPFNNEGPDGYDTIEWIAKQPWCNGSVGMCGGSYGGWVQWAAARERPPALKTFVSSAAAGDWMRELPWRYGMFSLVLWSWLNLVGGRTLHSGSTVDWEEVLTHLPLRTMDECLGRVTAAGQDWLDHPTFDDYWKKVRFTPEDFAGIDIPVLHITGWYDGDQPGELFFTQGMVEHSPAAGRQALMIGPWSHAGTRFPERYLGGQDFGESAVMDMDEVHLKWYDRYLKPDAPELDQPAVRYFVMGESRWVDTTSWPPPEAAMRSLYLGPEGGLQDAAPASAGSDSYRYDPERPVIAAVDWAFYAAYGNPNVNAHEADMSFDRRLFERRPDTLIYTTAELQEPLRIAGAPQVELWASSDCPDTDWVAHLSDVTPTGESIKLVDGVLRARFRDSLEREELMTPGQVYRFLLQMWSIGHEFKPGHRIRLAITSSEFPLYDRNLNTGKPLADDSEPRVATNTVHHAPEHASRILLPVVPAQ